MTDFIEKVHEHLAAKTPQAALRPSEFTRLSLGFITDELNAQEKEFQRKLGRIGEKARERMSVFADEMKASRDKIMMALEAVHELTALWEEEGEGRVPRLAKMLKRRIDYNKYKTQVLQGEYPETSEIQEIEQAVSATASQELTPNTPNSAFTIKCHNADSLEPCTPENDRRLDQQIKRSLHDLFASLERSLGNFKANYSHVSDEQTNQLVNVLSGEYRRAKEMVEGSECPSFEEIQNVKELQVMVRATIRHKMMQLGESQQKILSSMQK